MIELWTELKNSRLDSKYNLDNFQEPKRTHNMHINDLPDFLLFQIQMNVNMHHLTNVIEVLIAIM